MQLSQIFAQISGCLPARRGRIFKQHYTRTDSNGVVRQTGPYYVLTRSVGGKTHSRRIRTEDVPAMQAQIDRGEALSALVEKIWEFAEEAAEATVGSKKKTPPAKSRKRS